MKFIFTLLFGSFLLLAKSQSPSLQWVRTFGSSSNDYCNSISIDDTGNSISTGYYGNTIDFDPSPNVYNLTSNGHFDIFVLKLDPSGNFIWAKSIGGNGADIPVAVKLDTFGNIFIAGGFGGTVDFDPGPGTYNLSTGSPSESGSFILKLDANGNFLWAKQFSSYIGIQDIALDNSGNTYAAGGFLATADFDPSPSTYSMTEFSNSGPFTGKEDAFVLKLNAMGDFVWSKQMGGSENDQAKSISIDASGNILTSGYFSGNADFDPNSGSSSLTSIGSLDVFISKLDANGNYLWAKQIGGVSDERSFNITTDVFGNIYVVGSFSSNVDFDPGIGVNNITALSLDGFILKLTSSGTFVWAKQIGGPSTDFCRAITLDEIGNLYIIGSFESTCDFDPGTLVYNLTSKGYQDIFTIKLDNSGNFIWANAMGSVTNNDYGLDIKIDQSRKVYTVGFFWGTVDFDPTPSIYNVTEIGTGDAFIQKLSQCNNVTYSTINAFECNSYTLNSRVYSNSGTYTQSISNAGGCDSIITINLKIGRTITNLSAIACDSYFWNGNLYTSSGIYSDTVISVASCDSILRLNLIIKKKSISTINASICNGQTYAGYSLEGNYIDTFRAANGCDSIRTLHLSVNPIKTSSITTTICEGKTFLSYSLSGIYRDTFKTVYGCDSIRTLFLTVLPKIYTSITKVICSGNSYMGYNLTGFYIDTFVSVNGCDSIRQLSLSVTPLLYININKSICKGETYLGHSASGSYSDTVKTLTGCDSIINTTLFVLDKPTFRLPLDTALCEGTFFYLNVGSYPSIVWQDSSKSSQYLVTKAGKYSVRISNQCGITTSQINVRDSICDIFIPNAFSPNGDGVNDLWEIKGLESIKNFRLKVFARNGIPVFESIGYPKKWDGTWNKGTLPVGVYYYILTDITTKKIFSGWVSIFK